MVTREGGGSKNLIFAVTSFLNGPISFLNFSISVLSDIFTMLTLQLYSRIGSTILSKFFMTVLGFVFNPIDLVTRKRVLSHSVDYGPKMFILFYQSVGFILKINVTYGHGSIFLEDKHLILFAI